MNIYSILLVVFISVFLGIAGCTPTDSSGVCGDTEPPIGEHWKAEKEAIVAAEQSGETQHALEMLKALELKVTNTIRARYEQISIRVAQRAQQFYLATNRKPSETDLIMLTVETLGERTDYSPDLLFVYLHTARAYKALSDWKMALRYYQEALKVAPHNQVVFKEFLDAVQQYKTNLGLTF